jgi:hypothetical protein
MTGTRRTNDNPIQHAWVGPFVGDFPLDGRPLAVAKTRDAINAFWVAGEHGTEAEGPDVLFACQAGLGGISGPHNTELVDREAGQRVGELLRCFQALLVLLFWGILVGRR